MVPILGYSGQVALCRKVGGSQGRGDETMPCCEDLPALSQAPALCSLTCFYKAPAGELPSPGSPQACLQPLGYSLAPRG